MSGASICHDLADSGVGRGVETSEKHVRVDDDLEAERLRIAGNLRLFARMVDSQQAAERVVREELKGRGEAGRCGGGIGAPGTGQEDTERDRTRGRSRGDRDCRGPCEDAPEASA